MSHRLETKGSLVLVIVDDVPLFHVFSMEDGITRLMAMQDDGSIDSKTFEDLVVLLRSSDLPKFNNHALEENIIRCTVYNRLLESRKED